MKFDKLLKENIAISGTARPNDRKQFKQPQQNKESSKGNSSFDKEVKEQKIKLFMEDVKELAKKYGLDFFIAIDETTASSNANDSELVKYHIEQQKKFDEANKPPKKDWSKDYFKKIVPNFDFHKKSDFKPDFETVRKAYGL